MRTSITAHVNEPTRIDSFALGRDSDVFATLIIGDIGLICTDADDLERIAAEAIAGANELRAAQVTS